MHAAFLTKFFGAIMLIWLYLSIVI